MSKEWQTSNDFQKCCCDYHDAFARQPCGERVKEAKQILELIKPFIAERMAEQGLFGLKRYEHRGSSYEGVKIAKSSIDQDLEYDLMYVINGGRDLECQDLGYGGFVKLKLKSIKEPNKLFQKTVKDSYISAWETKNLFYKHLVGCKLEELKEDFKGSRITCKPFYHDPATKLEVYRGAEKILDLDLAPHFDLSGIPEKEEMYLPKDMKIVSNPPNDWQWLRSYSLDEKRKFKGIDRNNGCRKMVLRTMKAFVKRRPELSWLSSQHLKTALFKTLDVQRSWTQEEFSQRFMDTLGTLENCLEKKSMPSYFQSAVDLFENYKNETMQLSENRFGRFSQNGPLMMKLLSTDMNK